MGRFVVLALLALPFVEIAGFIWIGGMIGIFPTLALIVLGGIAGIAILRWQGTGLLRDSQAMMARGEVPARQFAEMAMVAVAGVLLLVPGFVTDIVAIVLFVPPVRRALYGLLSRNMVVSTHYSYTRPGGGPQTGPRQIDLDSDDYR